MEHGRPLEEIGSSQTARCRRAIAVDPISVLVLLVGFGARVYALAGQSLWTDEIYNYSVSRWTLGQVWRDLVHDHVPLYTILLGWWQVAAGSSELSLRYLSVLCSVAMLPLLLVLGRRFLPTVPLYVAVFLVAVSPFQIAFAQEVVAYSLLGFLALLVTWLFLSRLSAPTAPVLLLAGILYATLLYTHYAGFFVLLTDIAVALAAELARWGRSRLQSRVRSPFNVDLVAEPPRVSSRWSLAWGIGVALFLPWAIPHAGAVGDNLVGGTSRSVISLLGATFTDLSFGPVFTDHLDAGRADAALVLRNLALASLVLPLALGLAIWPGWRKDRSFPPARERTRRVNLGRGRPEGCPYSDSPVPIDRANVRGDQRRLILVWRWDDLVALLHAVIPFAVLLVLVQFSREFVSRYGFPAVAWVPVVVVLGLWRLPPPARWIGVLALLAFSAWGDVVYLEHPTFARYDFRDATAYVLDHRAPGDAVVITAPYVAPAFAYYADPAGHQNSPLPIFALPETMPMNDAATRAALKGIADAHPRVWLLRWQDYYADPRGTIANWLGANGYPLDDQRWPGGVALDLWATRPPMLASLPPLGQSPEGQIDQVRLVGDEVATPRSDQLDLTLYWRLDAPLADDDTVFVHLDTPGGQTVARADARPYAGRFPTDHWPVGPIIGDVRQVPLPPCLAPGRYVLSLGFYVLKTMRRLGGPGQDVIRLPIDVRPPPAAAPPGPILSRLPAALRLDNLLPDPPASCGG